VAAAAELAQHLMPYWASRGPFGDVRRVLTSLAELAPGNSVARGRLLWVAAVMAASQNDYEACAAFSEESLRIGTAARDVEVVGWALILSSVPRFRDGDLAGAKDAVESALSLARLMQLDQVELDAHNTLCTVLIAAGEIARAIEVGERGVALSGLPASSTLQLERAWDAWQAERYQRGEISQRPGYADNPFRPR
jgi:ATP/maltotriose-dependent transcriptional regulator MalT